MDYGSLSTVLMFDVCEMRRCVNVRIVDDAVLELSESFDVNLERTSGLERRIRLNPVDGEIVIDDNDGMYDINVQHCRY